MDLYGITVTEGGNGGQCAGDGWWATVTGFCFLRLEGDQVRSSDLHDGKRQRSPCILYTYLPTSTGPPQLLLLLLLLL
jgi:hypothetical protein